jgi:type VI secretion system protein ImpM
MSKQMNGHPSISGWYGKLPSAGDFVARGLPHAVQERVEEWVGLGLIQLRHRLPDWQWLFAQSPMWSFVLPRGVFCDEPLLGCVVPSADRVGRQFPWVALSSFTVANSVDADLPPHGRWHAATSELIADAHHEQLSVDQFDREFQRLCVNRSESIDVRQEKRVEVTGDIFAVLGDAGGTSGWNDDETLTSKSTPPSYQFSWPELRTLFDPFGTRSFWWTLGGGAISKRLAHDGELTAHLFITLFTQSLHAPAHGNGLDARPAP